MRPFAVTTFLSAFLLFQVQLIIGKYLLPWFGGAPAVWTTCLVFFQVALLAGYLYSHLLEAGRLPWRASGQPLEAGGQLLEAGGQPWRVGVHLVMVACAGLFLAWRGLEWPSPITPGASWKPTGQEAPAPYTATMLLASVGLPYFVLATTGPLLQSWFARRFPGRSPYRLYALSNAGSLLALLSYPLFTEPVFRLQTQAWLWSAVFGLFAVGCVVCGVATTRGAAAMGSTGARRARGAPEQTAGDRVHGTAARSPGSMPAMVGGGGSAPGAGSPGSMPAMGDRGVRWRWVTLPAAASAFLVATTSQLCQDTAVIPLLWVLPLALYLISFIIAFDHDRWYARGFFFLLLAVCLFPACVVLYRGLHVPIAAQIAVYCCTLFAACMVCHGELARSKPASSRLTAYYLSISIGGAIGGLLAGAAAPRVFPLYWEYPLGLWCCCLLAAGCWWKVGGSVPSSLIPVALTLILPLAMLSHLLPAPGASGPMGLVGGTLALAGGSVAAGWRPVRRWGARRPTAARRLERWSPAAALVSLALVLSIHATLSYDAAALTVRNFYGVLQVREEQRGEADHAFRLYHGRTAHGVQYAATSRRREPTAYYSEASGIGVLLKHHPRRLEGGGLRVGGIGLGVGTIAAYGRPGDLFRFYEINPQVIALARDARFFTFLSGSAARIEVVEGDARLSLERELEASAPQRFDVLAIDAFSSDAIPVHLLTREAMALYLRQLGPKGVLAFHLSNRYLDLKPVVGRLAEDLNLDSGVIDVPEGGAGGWGSTWMLVAQDGSVLASPGIAGAIVRTPSAPAAARWTDDYSSLVEVVKR